jgi:membrane protease YdiL (CAAX protease family)
VDFEKEELAMATNTIETKVLFVSIGSLIAAEAAMRVVLAGAMYPPMLILGMARLVEIFLLLLIVSLWGKGMSSIGLARDQIMTGVKKGLIWSAVFGLCACLGFVVLFTVHENPLRLIKTDLPSVGARLILFFVVGGLVAPIAEEIFFRGVIYGFLRRWGVLLALAGTTVTFVLAHAISSRIPLTQIVGGIVFAVAYEVEGKLMVPITIHVLGNMAIFTLSLVS